MSEFDEYVDSYDDQHRKSIELSGEDPSFFAEYKIHQLARLSERWKIAEPVILDFGCGIGSSLPYFRKHFPNSEFILSDTSSKSLAAAKALHGGDERVAHIEDGGIPLPDQCVDLIFSACVFHHIPHASHIDWLKELRRVARPGARIVIFEHNPFNPLTRHAVANCPFDANAHLLSARQLRERLVLAGWGSPASVYTVFFPRFLGFLRGLEPALGWLPLGGQYFCHAQRA